MKVNSPLSGSRFSWGVANRRATGFRLDFIHLLVSPRRYAAEEYVKSRLESKFHIFPKR
jgi:hypothetical protein